MMPHAVQLHRVIKASPEKVFRAFSDPIAYATWIPPYGFLCTVQQFEFEIGGNFHMTFMNFTSGHAHSFGGKILEMMPHEYIVYSDQFDNPNLAGTMTTSVRFKPVLSGTEITIMQENIPAEIPTEMCYLGWQDSLDKLIRLVEPEIPDGA